MGIQDKVVIEVGINENQFRSENPHVPYTPEEIGADAKRCYEAGAAVVHYHARDPDTGTPNLLDVDLNLQIMHAIQDHTPLLVHPTFDGVQRVLDYYELFLKMPDGYNHIVKGIEDKSVRWELGHGDLLFPSLHHLKWRIDFCKANGLKLKFAMFNVGNIRLLRNAIASGWISGDAPLVVQFGFAPPEPQIWSDESDRGLAAGFAAPFTMPATLRSLNMYLEEGRDLPLTWMPLVYQSSQLAMNMMALANGGHVRIGIGDYHYAELGHPTNAELVERIVRAARAMGREPATPDEAREIFGIAAARAGHQ